MNDTPYKMAHVFLGRTEIPGSDNDPLIMEWLKLDHSWPSCDEVPWCSAFVNWICKLWGLPRSKSLMARSWLAVGEKIRHPIRAKKGFDVVILSRGRHPQPGPEVITAPGHVGFFSCYKGEDVLILGGNQSNTVSVQSYSKSKILGVRRLYSG